MDINGTFHQTIHSSRAVSVDLVPLLPAHLANVSIGGRKEAKRGRKEGRKEGPLYRSRPIR